MARKKRSLGYGFPDEVTKVTPKRSYFKQGAEEWKDFLIPNFDASLTKISLKSGIRVTGLLIIILIFFFVIFLRLFHLQIVRGSLNRERADGNRILIKVTHAPRGVIYDRNGKILASNSPAFRLFDKGSNRARLITREEALELEVKNDQRALDLEIDNVRTYPMGEKFAHLLGYIGEISQQQLQKVEYEKYRLGDKIGQSGIEAQYEKILKGVDGGEIIEVDSKGVKLRILRVNPATAGQNVYLTVDADLQDKIYQLMKDTLRKVGSCCGAVLAMDPKSGQILALLSFPSFNPNTITYAVDENAILQIFSHPDSPILNRSIAGTYPPGSTFKIVSSLSALSSGKVTPDTTIVDNGVIYLGTFKFSNWYFNQYGKVEGSVNLLKAIQRSNDTYFYEISRIIGENALTSWARKLKLGGKLEIDIPGEAEGLVPDDEWKRKTFGLPWYPGDTLHLGIGQGFVLTTPLQILGITSYIAADGNLYQPHILSSFKAKVLVSNLIDQEKIKIIKEGLKLVPKDGGTAWPLFTFPIPTAGKTGTAEFGDAKNRTHAWYTSYAPADDPKIAITVLIEAGGEGSSVAAPIVKEVFRWYFSPDKNNLIQDVYIQATDSGKTLGE